MPDLSVAAAHLRQRAAWRRRWASSFDDRDQAVSPADEDDAVAVLLEAIEDDGLGPTWTLAAAIDRIRVIRAYAGAVAAVVVPQTERSK